jgi:hypothetical protein
MKKIVIILAMLIPLLAADLAYARNQQADDCPPGNKDPDCKGKDQPPPPPPPPPPPK